MASAFDEKSSRFVLEIDDLARCWAARISSKCVSVFQSMLDTRGPATWQEALNSQLEEWAR